MRSIGYHEVMAVLEGKITIGAGGDVPNETSRRGRRPSRFSGALSACAASELLEPMTIVGSRRPQMNHTERQGA